MKEVGDVFRSIIVWITVFLLSILCWVVIIWVIRQLSWW